MLQRVYSHEDQLLVAAVRTFLDPLEREKLQILLRATSDVPSLVERARAHGLLPLLSYLATEATTPRTTMRPELAAALAGHWQAAQLDSLRVEAETRRVIGLLGDAGVRPIVLKGVAVADALYPQPALRPIGDLDLVIRESEWARVHAAMSRDAAEPLGLDCPELPPRLVPDDALDHCLAFRTTRGLRVELGLDPLELGLAARSRQDFFDWSDPLDAYPPARTLSPEDQLVVLACHLNRHGYQRLVWFLDVALLVRQHPQLDWDVVAETARREGLEASLHHTLRLVAETTGVDLAPAFARIGRPRMASLVWRHVWSDQELSDFSAPHEGPLVFRKSRNDLPALRHIGLLAANVALTGRGRDKARFAARKLFPSHAFLAEKYGAPSSGYWGLWLQRLQSRVVSDAERESSFAEPAPVEVMVAAEGPAPIEMPVEGDAPAVLDDPDQDLGRRFDVGVLWNALSKFATRFSTFFVTVVLARLLTPADFGLSGMAVMVTGFLVMLSEFGFAYGIIQRPEISDDDICSVFSLGLSLGIVLAIICFVGAPWFAELLHTPTLTWPLRGVSVGIILSTLMVTPRALLFRRMDFRSIAVSDVAQSITYGVTAISLAAAGMGVWSLIVAGLLMALCGDIVLFLRARYRFRFRISVDSIKTLLPYGSRVFAGEFVAFLRGNLDYVVVGRMLGAASLGLYTVAFRVADFPRSRLGRIVAEVSLPAISSVQSDDEQVHATYRRSARLGAFITFPLLIGMAAVAYEFVYVVYGAKWLAAVPALQILVPMALLLVASEPAVSVLLAKGEASAYMWISIGYALCVWGFAALGAGYGITGVAWGVFVATALYFVTFMTTARVRAGIRFLETLRAWLGPIVGCAAMLTALAAYRGLATFTGSELERVLWLVGAVVVGGIGYSVVAFPLTGIRLPVSRRRERESKGTRIGFPEEVAGS